MKNKTCVFCDIVNGEAPASIIYQDELCTAFMDLFPIKTGHALVIPNHHAALLEELDNNLRCHLFEVAHKILLAQKKTGIPCEATNIVVNDGKAANQHVPHVHVHVLPRTGGDTGVVGWNVATRMFNVFGLASRRKQLDKLAKALAEQL